MRPPWDEASPLSLALIASRGQCVAIAPGPPTKPRDGERKKLNCGLRIMVSQSLPSALPRHFNPSWLTAHTAVQFWIVLREKGLGGFGARFPPSRWRRTCRTWCIGRRRGCGPGPVRGPKPRSRKRRPTRKRPLDFDVASNRHNARIERSVATSPSPTRSTPARCSSTAMRGGWRAA
jgi:hypothetical protein